MLRTTPRRTTRRPPVLRYSPSAWAKLLFLRDQGATEIGGFGISEVDDPLYVHEVALVPQRATAVTVVFDDAAVADFFDQQIDRGRKPEQFARIWIHTHPGHSARPSATDEHTFQRVFGECDWAVMAILARGGSSSARLRFNQGPGAAIKIRTEVDFSMPFDQSRHEEWLVEYQSNIRSIDPFGAGIEGFRERTDRDDLAIEPGHGEAADDLVFDAAFW